LKLTNVCCHGSNRGRLLSDLPLITSQLVTPATALCWSAHQLPAVI
jgi:hypothetical protein